MTKRFTAAVAALLCAAVGILRWVDLAGNTDPATGFLLSGQVPIRYLLLALPVLAIFLAGVALPGDTHHTVPAGAMVPAFCGMLFSGIIGISLFALGHSSSLQLLAAVLLALGSLWFGGYVMRPSSPPLLTGLLGTAGWLIVCLWLFSTKISSIHHMLVILELLCTLGILLQMAGLLRGIYAAGQKGSSRSLFIRSMLGFYCGVCLLLPQEIWMWQNDLAAGCLQGKCVAAAALGITGLATALYCVFNEGAVIVDANDPEAVQATFAEAGRRLEQELTNIAAAPVSPAGQPRWRSAASTLYGGSGRPAPQNTPAPAVPSAPQPVRDLFAESRPAATAAAPAASQDARPVIVSDASPAKPTEKPVQKPVERPVQKPAPSAAPDTVASTLDRLDSLLAQLNTQPAKHDTVDDILGGLGGSSKQKDAAPPPAEGEKWVFHR